MPPAKQPTAEVLSALKSEVAVLDERLSNLQKQIDRIDLTAALQKIAVLEAQVAELKREKDEAGKRQWQFVYIAAGAGLALLSSVLVQVVFFLLKK
jgi:hypothetical protein